MGFQGLDATGFTTTVYFDDGGASRCYPQFTDDDELRVWVEHLVGARGPCAVENAT